MYGTREELCVKLENMFAVNEPLTLLVWTTDAVLAACRKHNQFPAEEEARRIMKAIGDTHMAVYQIKGVTQASVNDMLTQHREEANRQVSVPAALLTRVLQDYECELEHRAGQAWEAGRPEPQAVQEARNDVYRLKEALAA